MGNPLFPKGQFSQVSLQLLLVNVNGGQKQLLYKGKPFVHTCYIYNRGGGTGCAGCAYVHPMFGP